MNRRDLCIGASLWCWKNLMIQRWRGGLRFKGPVICSFIHSSNTLDNIGTINLCHQTRLYTVDRQFHYCLKRPLVRFTMSAEAREELQTQSQGVSPFFRKMTGMVWWCCSPSPPLLPGCCSVAQSCLTLCSPMDCNTPGFRVLRCLLEKKIVSTGMTLSCPLSRWCYPTISSSVAPISSCPQSFPVSGSFPVSRPFSQVAKVLELQLQHQFFQWIFRVDFL